MPNIDLAKNIKKLDKIQPSQEWLDSTRHNLLVQMDFDSETRKSSFLFNKSIALALCMVIIVFGGPWLAVKAAKPSLPGELLYSVKKISEEIQSTVSSNNNRVQLKTDFASRRLEELTKLNELDEGHFSSEQEKTEKVKQVVSDFKGNLANVSQNLGKISKAEAVIVAKKARKIQENLDKTKDEMSLVDSVDSGQAEEVRADLAEAEQTIKEINQQILTVLLKDRENAEETATTTFELEQEILIFLEETDNGTMTTTEIIINVSEE
ncbi:MAG: DUF5667 domain-containing protein [bacterium]